MPRPQLLYLTHRVPHPPNRGDRIRTYHMLRHLSQFADVSLACLADEPVSDETHRELNRLCVRVGIVPVEKRLRWVRAGLSLLRGRTISEGAFQSPALTRLLTEWGEATSFDATLASSSALAPYLRLPALSIAKASVDLIDVDSQKWLDYAAASRGPKRWLYRHEGQRMRRLEASLATWTHRVLVVSEAEADIFRSFCPNGPITAVANGVDVDYFQPANSLVPTLRVGTPPRRTAASDAVDNPTPIDVRDAERQEARSHAERGNESNSLVPTLRVGTAPRRSAASDAVDTPTPIDVRDAERQDARSHAERGNEESCVFVGALDYKPNIDGAIWFCQHIWPSIRTLKPNAVIKLVGREPTREVQALGEIPGVEVIGTVPDVRPYLAEAAVVVVPLQIARGVQNKVLEAMAMGKAIVASPEPIVGLQVEPGVHLLRAVNVDEWVSQVTTLFDDAALRAEMGLAAQAYVTANHRWEQCLTELPRLLCKTGTLARLDESRLPVSRVASAPGPESISAHVRGLTPPGSLTTGEVTL
ncbi:MAG: glycosyltransferase [Planctomycetaceae bacterium]